MINRVASPRPSPLCGEGDMKALKFLQNLVFTNDEGFELQTSNEFLSCRGGSLSMQWGG